MMKAYIATFRTIVLAVLCAVAVSACDDSKSFAELLNDENQYVNNFLADQTVCLEIPADTAFIYGPDAPYYSIDEDKYLYMQVIEPGTKGNMVKDNEQIYFRYTMWPLAYYDHSTQTLKNGYGNNTALGATWFRYNNFSMMGSYQWGAGIQKPLSLLPVDCKVRLVVKSQMGIVDMMNDVQPYLFELTYQRAR
ncbi:MAG: DUF4827 domain-containing protein [Bacteroidales bacterium]|nr:DUF4827 domain-containing protein [Bacteroidales bacterium]MBD5216658.1 DUF4827 domain-containing protein [Bacteroidales bacterium]MBD5219576.1 DUF4827 domain-containing protein [Bacteroidales bacterium]MDE6437266.1 DUF4827 domain-containing protein [Muribaculaceae bacterium]